jgi:hypothetical protein
MELQAKFTGATKSILGHVFEISTLMCDVCCTFSSMEFEVKEGRKGKDMLGEACVFEFPTMLVS